MCVLEKTLTPVERTLTTLDEHQRLRDIRMLFQDAAEQDFRRAVEETTGRKVIAFVSGIDTKADVSSELFTLAPLRVLTRPPAPVRFGQADAGWRRTLLIPPEAENRTPADSL